jgi:ribosomal-protein-alanine N-acetyltransferase
VIRSATREDLDKIELIEKQFGAEAFSRRSLRHLIMSDNVVLVLEFGGEIFGCLIALFRSDRPTARLYSLLVAESHRKRGYAVEMVQSLVRICRDREASGITLEVAEGNYPAIALYGSLGFQTTGRVDGYYHDGSAALKMYKPLI